MTQLDTWTGCYDLNWKNLITPAAFSHPAKFSHGLIKRIYEHALAEGMIQPGGVILDPFGGVGLGALYAMQNGLHWVGVELESKFVELGCENIALWNARYAAHFPNWGTAQILAGDSRRLAEVVSAAGLVVSSPPYATNVVHGDKSADSRLKRKSAPANKWGLMANGELTQGDYGFAPGQLGSMKEGDISAVISSPPFAGNSGGRGEASRNGIDAALFDRHSGGMKKGTGDDPANLDHLPQGSIGAVISSPPYAESEMGGKHGEGPNSKWRNGKVKSEEEIDRRSLGAGYGSTDGQLGAMKPGEISAVIASPPFADSVGSDDPDKRGGLFRDEKRRNDVNLTGTYGETEGQLGGMKAGAVISSPPYEGTNVGNGDGENELKRLQKKAAAGELKGESLRLALQGRLSPHENANLADYGSTDGQIGATQGQTFWEAARLIVEQCALLLPPGGAAIWVVKGYIKNGKYVDFPGQWQALCEACGFETVHVHRAMLVKENGAQGNMFGAAKKNKTERKSFFRRLHEARQKAAKHWATLSRSDKALALWVARGLLWAEYRVRLANFEALTDQEKVDDPHGEPTPPTRNKILSTAKSAAWNRDGSPDYEIETEINFETVLCMRKAASPRGTGKAL